MAVTRSVPVSLAPVVERLELGQPEIVTLKQLAEMAEELGVRTAPALIAFRLRERGWLLSTGLSGAWEFAPGAHAGPHSRGGPLLPVRAALALVPDLSVAVALTSAAWVYGLGDRAPPRIELAVKPGEHIPAGLGRKVGVRRIDSMLGSARHRGVPVQRFETILVHMAARPSHITSWGAVPEWLGDIVEGAGESELLLEMSNRTRSVRARLAYLIQGLWPELANRLGAGAKTRVWFGPRDKPRRQSRKWGVADSILPFDPAKLPAVR